jgi:hypothetical protein
MGFRKDWDMNAIQHQIWIMRSEASSSYNDGFTAFEIKKDLYKLKWQIDQALKNCREFSGETEWLQEQEKQRIINILKK